MIKKFRPVFIFILSLSILLIPTLFITIEKTHAASILLSIDQGTTGISVMVTGDGFTGKLASIKWNGNVIDEEIPISENGKLSYELYVPRAAKGTYSIEVADDSHWSGSTASATFRIIPKIEVFPKVGKPSSEISIIGTGFPSRESDIVIIWDGTTLKSPSATADFKGTWSITIRVPTTIKGEHRISASGSITSATELGDIVFIVGPSANIMPLTGPVGTEIIAKGIGFRVGEDGITIAFDGEIIVCNIVGASDGSWESSAQIPPSTKGKHRITVYGSSFTPIGTIPDFDFEVVPSLDLDPPVGNTGNKITATGTGFSANESINLIFDDVTLNTDILTNKTGSFSTTFIVPQIKGMEHTVTASGNKGNLAKSAFMANKPPPTAPVLDYPAPNAKIMIFDSFTAVIASTLRYAGNFFRRSTNEQLVYPPPNAVFSWSHSSNSKDIEYILQIAPQKNFASTSISRSNISNRRYVISQYDSLPPGTYFWRVKAIDNIGNESSWSEIHHFEVITMSSSVLVLSISIPALFTAILLAPILIAWRSRRNN